MSKNDGKYLEDFVKKEFEILQKETNYTFRYERLYDSTSAGKIIQAKTADFRFCMSGVSGHLECKSTANKTFRLDKFPQLPRMKAWEMAGSVGLVLTHFHTPDIFKLVHTIHLSNSDKSHDLKDAREITTEDFRESFMEAVCLSQTLYKAGL